jgi:hypothetical protein
MERIMRRLIFRVWMVLMWPLFPLAHAILALLQYEWGGVAEDYRLWAAAFKKGRRLVNGE